VTKAVQENQVRVKYWSVLWELGSL